jgi:GntR family transcriptional regulator, transcriptional repressor for pyruvate dehydrogenase complex
MRSRVKEAVYEKNEHSVEGLPLSNTQRVAGLSKDGGSPVAQNYTQIAGARSRIVLPGMAQAPELRRKGSSQKLTHALVEALSESIHSSTIRPGDKLPSESMIMAEYGVSRTVVREAIISLQAAGLIKTRHGIGSFVSAVPDCFQFRIDASAIITVEDVLAMLELRIGLETDAAAFAAARRTDRHIEEMRRALNAFRTNLDRPEKTVESDFQFHLQIAHSTGNRYFVDIMSHLGTKTIPRTRVDALQGAASHTQYLNVVNNEHKRIFEAVLRRDPEGSRAAMRAHLVSSRERLRRAHALAMHDET